MHDRYDTLLEECQCYCDFLH